MEEQILLKLYLEYGLEKVQLKVAQQSFDRHETGSDHQGGG